jgi:trk system potassium uptake protein TrkA
MGVLHGAVHVIVVGCGRVGSELATELEAQGHTVAVIDKNRIYDPRRAVIYQRLGIPTVATVAWTTDQVLRKLFPEKWNNEWSDASGSVDLVERMLPASWAGRKLTELDEGDSFRLVALTRGGQARLASVELVGQEGDVLYMAVRREHRDELDARLAEEGRHS